MYGQKLLTSISTEWLSQRQFLWSSKVFSNFLLRFSMQNCPTRKKNIENREIFKFASWSNLWLSLHLFSSKSHTHTQTQQQCTEIFSAKFLLNWSNNLGSTGKNSFTFLSKVWVSVSQFSQNSRLLDSFFTNVLYWHSRKKKDPFSRWC